MKIRVFASVLVCTVCLQGQHHFSWQDACFKNPAAPYCPGHEYAVKPTKNGTPAPGLPGSPFTNSAIDASGIDWRFADLSPDALLVLNCRKLSASPQAHQLIDQLAAKQGFSQAEAQNIFRKLSSVEQVALSVRDNHVALMLVGRAPDSVLPAPESGWKAVPLARNALLIGDVQAVDQAVQRISTESPLGELASLAQQRQADTEFWAAGSAKFAGEAAANAGVKQFSLTASLHDSFRSDTAFELNSVPDAKAIQPWLSSLGDAKVEGNIVHAMVSMEGDGQNLDKIASGPIGERLGVFIRSARNLPVRDTPTTVHTKPVIYGLDEGAKEVKQ
jgi:hypothetical protein